MADEAVIGLECHIQVRTRTKMFCACPAEFGGAPNDHVCPVCLGLPGALPRANRAAVDAALRLGVALGCTLRARSVFARKHYFYPDMPKNYQITQYDQPLCEGGALPAAASAAGREFALTRIHLEEDTGKSFHPERVHDRRVSRVEFNRAGVPLLELVTEPVFRGPAECGAFLTALRRLVRWLGISEGEMEKGQLRCDANVSVRPAGTTPLGTKTEIKNLNSIRGVERGVAAEIARQRRVIESGGAIQQATLLYDADRDALAVMRTKEDAHDYRYFPDPDLPVLVVPPRWIDDVRAAAIALPWETQRRLEEAGLPVQAAAVLVEDRARVDRAMAIADAGVPLERAAGWVVNVELGHVNRLGLSMDAFNARVPVASTGALLLRIESAQVTATAAKGLLEEVLERGADPGTLFATGGAAEGSHDALAPLVAAVIAEHPGPVAQYRRGKTATLGFLVGQVMQKSGGQAVPQAVRALLEAALAGPDADG
jgi:aspartyl-tRNA(Asn)/glutamyl-tRNA(Gln) amidotransferase subunit B